MQLDSIVENGEIIDSSNRYIADIGILDGKIFVIGKNLRTYCTNIDTVDIIDIYGCYVMPSGIDPHVHIDMECAGTKTSDNFYTGTVSAICGGTTSIIDYCIQNRLESIKESIEKEHNKAKGISVTDYKFHILVSNIQSEKNREELEEALENGYSSIKVFTTRDDLYLCDKEIIEILKIAKKHNTIVCFHAENMSIVDDAEFGIDIAEEEAVFRIIKLAEYCNTCNNVYIAHLSSKRALDIIINEHRKGNRILCETCPQYLILDEKNQKSNQFYSVSPPLRRKEDRDALWDGIRDGYIHVVATDHCPFKKEQKILNNKLCGLPGIELRIPLLFSYGVLKNRISIHKFVDVISTNSSQIFNMHRKIGSISIGSDADIMIIDPKKKITVTKDFLHENTDFSPYYGMELYGYPKYVLHKGRLVSIEGKFIGKRDVMINS